MAKRISKYDLIRGKSFSVNVVGAAEFLALSSYFTARGFEYVSYDPDGFVTFCIPDF